MKAISTRYLGPTNFWGARIKAFDLDGNQVTIPYPHEASRGDGHRIAAEMLRDKMGWTGRLIEGETKEGSVFVFAE